jgi:type I restriction enzyme, S subunit
MSAVNAERYAAYKDAGVYWIGKIPDAWRVLHLKNCVSKKITDGPHATPVFVDEGVPFLSAEAVQDGSLNFSSKRGYISDADDKIYSLKCKPKRHDIFIVKSGSTTGKVGYVSTDENFNIWSPLALVRCGKNFDPRYVYLFLSSSYFQQQVKMFWSFGTQPNIGMGVIEALQITVPTHHEQTAIAAYLDTKTAQIDRQIDLLSQKATQYGKLKQSLINETVTRGLDKSVPMKDSGVEWIGDVPAHWLVKKLSHSFRQIGSGTTPKAGIDIYYDGGTINWINTGDLNDGVLYSCKRTVTDEALRDFGLTIYPVGSIIIAMYGATIGKTSISMIEGCTNQACCVLNNSKTINVKFLFYWFLSKREFIISLSYGGGQPNISQDTIKSLRIISPAFEEQTTIAAYLDTKTAQIDRIVTAINTQIDKLKDLRKALINDVVTGKIKVVSGGAAA